MAQRVSRALFIIDPQNCFMDLIRKACQAVMPLSVVGAVADMDRLAAYIRFDPFRYDTIIVTEDTHPEDHISHANRWVDAEGKHPGPFTLIFHSDYVAGKWFAADAKDQQWQGEYLKQLEATGRVHTIWPIHGQEGQFEHRVYQKLKGALNYWEEMTGNKVQYVKKGMHRDTEQFGVFAAAVPIVDAPETHLNQVLVDQTNAHDEVDFVGEAASHCTKDSVDQYLEAIPKTDWSKVTVLRDTMSPVAAVCDEEGNVLVDFPAQAEAWLDELPTRGVTVDTVVQRMAA